MSIKKQLLALAISACVTTPVWAQVSLIDVYQLQPLVPKQRRPE